MARVRVALTLSGIRAVKESPEVVSILDAAAEKVLSRARAGAPVNTGAYRDSLHAYRSRSRRAGVVLHVGSTVDYAMQVEAATGNLSRALG